MTELDTVATVLGWCSLINILVLTASTLAVVVLRSSIVKLHSRLFEIEETQLTILYFKYLSAYKLITLCFFVVPYLSLKVVV
ncbi:DUF6868 family protein [Motilimonas eburnea]|uniref:DUF6868 family protein n=1 Tax=Motilimonas eburnea TaxID=1737488 RepID=UPI001E533854|nr:hypothetical protein [Motilimonas eburnea]MCE2570871.1 hypothetical protein [Motilimonas eburnea]